MFSNQSIYLDLPLDSHRAEIRILELDEAGCGNDTITGTLALANLQDLREPFGALSYMWASSTKRDRIILRSGHYLNITANLAAALRVIRMQGRRRRIWIDAICINQDSMEERNNQVRMMRRIYSCASLVITWIDITIDTHNPVLQRFKMLDWSSTAEDFGNLKDWQFMASIWSDPYWLRVWIQQEISSARSWKVQFSNFELSAFELYHWVRLLLKVVVQRLSEGNLDTTVPGPTVSLPERFGRRSSELCSFTESTFSGKDCGLLEILFAASHLTCTDNRDRLYGMMNMAKDVNEDNITVDYDLSLLETFMKVPRFEIECNKSLEFLSYAGIPTSQYLPPGHPTWLPRWANKAHLDKPGPLNHRLGLGRKCTFPKRLYPTILGDQSLHVYSLRLTKIVCMWNFFDEIQSYSASSTMMTVSKFMSDSINFALTARAQTTSTQDIDPDNATAWAKSVPRGSRLHCWLMLMRAMSLLDYRAEQPRIIEQRKSNSIIIKTMEGALSLFRDYCENRIPKSQTLYGYKVQNPSCFIVGIIELFFFTNHVPFCSSNGDIGMIPTSAKVNDELWYIPGCSSVMVLRIHPCGYYQVVGDAYLEPYNIMKMKLDLHDTVQEGDKALGSTIERIVLR